MNKGVMSDQNRGQMSSGILKASDRQRNFIKRETYSADAWKESQKSRNKNIRTVED
jgi:glutamine phosphoribosylpyrophosphate amidotransferase